MPRPASRPALRRWWWIPAAVAAVAAFLLVVGAPHSGLPTGPTEHADPTEHAGPPTSGSSASQLSERSEVTFAVVGDSITAADSPDIAHGLAGTDSWAYWANHGAARLVGGWALGGTTAPTMAANVTRYDADVLVIIAGTNDTVQGVTFRQSAAALRTIVALAGVPRVIVSSIPPQDADPSLAVAFNASLRHLAATEGWTYVDASAVLRSGDRFRAGLTPDGIHPTTAGAEALGDRLRTAILSDSENRDR